MVVRCTSVQLACVDASTGPGPRDELSTIPQALAAQMAAVVADAEWLEPHERDAVQQLLRNEYTAEAPPPPPPQPPPQQEQSASQAAGGAAGVGESDSSPATQLRLSTSRTRGSRPSDQVLKEWRQQAAGAGQQAPVDPSAGTAVDAVPPGVPAEAVRLLRCSTWRASAIRTVAVCCSSVSQRPDGRRPALSL